MITISCALAASAVYGLVASMKHFIDQDFDCKWLPFYLIYPIVSGMLSIAVSLSYLILFLDARTVYANKPWRDISFSYFDVATLVVISIVIGFYASAKKILWDRNPPGNGLVTNSDSTSSFHASNLISDAIRALTSSLSPVKMEINVINQNSKEDSNGIDFKKTG